MSVHLDPSEVLKYLNQLGYCNITKEQLKDFIYDLKKLIIHDISKFEVSETMDTQQSQTKQCSDYHGRPTVKSKPKPCPTCRAASGEVSDSITASESSEFWTVPCNTRNSSYKNVTQGLASSQTFKAVGKENIESQKRPPGKNITASTCSSYTGSTSESDFSSSISSKHCSNSVDTNAQLTKGGHEAGNGKHVKATANTTSFIRPWHLTSAKGKVPDLRRSDPVSLYHYYQSIWKKQKLPGEDHHADLRWSIREKMLGSDPHPRPFSQASSVEHLKRYRMKKC